MRQLASALEAIRRANILKMYLAHKREINQYLSGFAPPTEQSKEAKDFIEAVCSGALDSFIFWQQDRYFMAGHHIKNYNYIVDLYVAPEYRRKGEGTALLNQVGEPIILECAKESPARAFYEALDFSQLSAKAGAGCVWLYRGPSGLPRALAGLLCQEITQREEAA